MNSAAPAVSSGVKRLSNAATENAQYDPLRTGPAKKGGSANVSRL